MNGYIEILEVLGGFVWRFLVLTRDHASGGSEYQCIRDGSADTRAEARRAAEAFSVSWELGEA